MTPGRPRLTVDPERHELDLQLVRKRTRAGDSANEIAVELRCTGRTVVRYRAELRARGELVDPRSSAQVARLHPANHTRRTENAA